MEALAQNVCLGVSWPVPRGKNLPLYPLARLEGLAAKFIRDQTPKFPDANQNFYSFGTKYKVKATKWALFLR